MRLTTPAIATCLAACIASVGFAQTEDDEDIPSYSPAAIGQASSPSPASTPAKEAEAGTTKVADATSAAGILPGSALEAELDDDLIDPEVATDPIPAPSTPIQAVLTRSAPPVLAPVPNREVVLPEAAPRAPESESLLWANTPISVAFEQLSREHGLKIQYTPSGRDIAVNGDFRHVDPTAVLQSIIAQARLAVRKTDGVHYIGEPGTPSVIGDLKPVNTLVYRVYSVPRTMSDAFVRCFEEIASKDHRLTPISSPESDRSSFRIAAPVETHLKIEAKARQLADARALPVAPAIGVAKTSRDLDQERESLLKHRKKLLDSVASIPSRDW